MISLKKVNEYIQTKYPTLEIIKGKGYFYVCSDDDQMALALAGLYTTSIGVCKVSHLPLEKWMTSVESLLKDEYRSHSDRSPII